MSEVTNATKGLKRSSFKMSNLNHLIDVLVKKSFDPIQAMVEMASDPGIDERIRFLALSKIFDVVMPKRTEDSEKSKVLTDEVAFKLGKLMTDMQAQYKLTY